MIKTSLAEVNHWIQNLHHGFNGGACLSPKFLKPYHFVTLATELKRHSENALQIPEALLNYAVRMNLWEAIGVTPPYTLSKGAHGNFLPIAPLTSPDKTQLAANKLTTILKPYCLNKTTLDSLNGMLLELLENCFAHANIHHDLHGLACCQPWPKGKLAQIVLVDSGIGIRTSLSYNSTLLSRLKRENACELATEYGITGKPKQNHSGYGLTLARDLIDQNLGNVIIISGSEAFQSCEGKQKTSALEIPWQGTLILLELNTDHSLDVKKVYQQWPLPEGITTDDLEADS